MAGKLRVLLVEDDDVDRNLIHRKLGDVYEFVDANTGHDARELLRGESFDCALLDYVLPDMEGLELISDLQASRVPFVMIVATGEDGFATGTTGHEPKDDLSKAALDINLSATVDDPRDQNYLTTILYADDEEADRVATDRALGSARLGTDLRFVENGQQLLDYLYRRGEFADAATSPRPNLILLDLNMPEMTGQEALEEIRKDSELNDIPIVVLTTSTNENDITRMDQLRADGYCVKPVGLDKLTAAVQLLGRYWVQIIADNQ